MSDPTPTVAELILQNVATTLTAALTGVKVERTRLRPYELSELPAVAITPVEENVEYGPGPRMRGPGAIRKFFFEVEISVPGEPPDAELDLHRGNVVVALMKDRSLGGNAIGIGEAGSKWEAEAASNAVYGVLIIRFEVEYHTRADDARAKL